MCTVAHRLAGAVPDDRNADHDYCCTPAPEPLAVAVKAGGPIRGASVAAFRVAELDCATEEGELRAVLGPLEGVRWLEFDLVRILTIALTFEILFLALSLTGELVERGLSTARATLIPIAASTATIVGALVGAAILGHATNAIQAAVLAFGSAALLYLVTEELLTEAHDTPDTTLHVAMFFVGFIALFTLEGIL